uniref:C3H1-type domain-containing protein n=1 Tax=Eptatretus burgeri TaxID=7764 RepID=A0A8C4R9J6_EPTBU
IDDRHPHTGIIFKNCFFIFQAFMRRLLCLLWGEADSLYHEDQLLQALSQYQEALQLLDYMASEGIGCPSSANEKLHANRAACYLRLGDPTEVLTEATEALQKNSRNVRALYRKAWALSALQNHKEAYDDIVVCALLLPQVSITSPCQCKSVAVVAASTESQGAVTGMANLALLSRNPLAETHEFRQACTVCFFKTGEQRAHFNDNSFYPNLDHVCRKDVLISRLRNASKEGWKRIRPRPNVNYLGPYYMCKEVAEGVDCSYPGRCTFAYCQEEIDVWTLERKGIFHRDHLFDTGPSKPRITLAQILAEHRGGYLFLCLECFNCKPRTLSKRNPDSPNYCSTPNVRHIFDENKCLVHVEQGATLKYCKIRPLTEHTQLDLCQARYGCAWHDSCNYAHSLVELKTWVLQLETGQVSSDGIKTPRLYHQLKFVCSDCWRSGLATGPDPKRKYCESKARHLWSIKKCILLASSPERKRWMPIRTLPATKIQPAQYEMCAHVANGKKCQYIGNCTFAHSQEEKEIWTYMKENKVNDMEKLYQLWIQKQDAKVAASKTNATGFHCWLCGKNCNSEKQWEQHIQSEKHKDRIFLEDDTQTWQFRFPAGEFYLCNWTKGGHECPEGDKCQYSHSEPELREWEERRVFLRQKFEKAVEDKLILPSDNFSKYNFLLK